MKFVCLHGAGTNAEIFEIQTGGLCQVLKAKGHRFRFLNGKFEAPVEKELEGVIDGPFFNHYARTKDPPPGPQVEEGMENVYQFMAARGPFDGIMGFSQGGSLAARLIIKHAEEHPLEAPLFRCAIFLCAGQPWDSSGTDFVEPRPDYHPINIPTAHIVGKNDHIYPMSTKVYQLCEPSKASYYDHGGGHQIPFQSEKTDEMVRVIEEAIDRALKK
ncbi:hypothetical protein N7468_000587 [Penicillium chermesinum]|uniref:Serine hydrolase domain-containing protein n=1 Tax=Penicillium chermesinum TaxID=63820 RepID=A0A9W9PKK7_9EURO|nr:uncharacterized protein N7468_000587 [Penicillium chermesinum]KAJ5249136.1 hypothetical protein N7468_000587 [Penicillium chermesinum]KAJ6151234.1 hypothetical protein N7470_007828 [Penicillium chermesinum]